MPDEFYQALERQGLILFQYCDERGEVIDNFPVNPNGSIGNIAAISNQAGNIMAIMPHPERTTNGDVLFQSMRDFIIAPRLPYHSQVSPIHKTPATLPLFMPAPKHSSCIIRLIITDNEALTVQKTLQKLGIPVRVNRLVHWEIDCSSSTETFERIKKSGVLYCDRKEHEVNLPKASVDTDYFCLVRAKDNLAGQHAKQTLIDHYGILATNSIKHSILWHFTSDGNIQSLMDEILLTNIIGNQYAHELFSYNGSLSQ